MYNERGMSQPPLVVSVVGNRPQFVKLAPVSRALRGSLREAIVHTEQHYDPSMAGVFFGDLSIPAPDHLLGVRSGSHAEQTARTLLALEPLLVQLSPAAVLVFGDTNATLAATIAAVKLHLPVVHVEAGPRLYDGFASPEEANRVATDHLSTLLLAPTEHAAANLAREGLGDRTVMTGDPMYDVYLASLPQAEATRPWEALDLPRGDYVLLTLHRPANVDDPAQLATLVRAVRAGGLPVIFPVHPRTRRVAEAAGIALERQAGFFPIEPVGYLAMVALERSAEVVVTDSGGVQKEAFFSEVPCINLANRSAWPETVEAGWNVAIGHDPGRITEAIRSFRPRGAQPRLFGEGHAADAIAEAIRHLVAG